jgi:hypothetical protein
MPDASIAGIGERESVGRARLRVTAVEGIGALARRRTSEILTVGVPLDRINLDPPRESSESSGNRRKACGTRSRTFLPARQFHYLLDIRPIAVLQLLLYSSLS